jgi:predicted GTPase
MKNVIIMGGGGRDFHNFNVVYRDDPATEVVAFTATQIPGIDQRRYPRSLAGTLPRRDRLPEDQLPELIREPGRRGRLRLLGRRPRG